MKTLNIKYLLAIIVLAIFYSCEYEPKEIYELGIEPEPPESFQMELDLEADTIYSYGSKNINYTLSSEKFIINSIQFKLNDSTIYERSNGYQNNEASGTINLPLYSFPEGEYKLKLLINTNSATGSLGDQLGLEEYTTVAKEWTLFITKGITANYGVKGEEFEGGLKLSWEGFSKPGFDGFEVYKRISTEKYLLAVTNEPFFTDTNYIGEGAHYTVYLKLKSYNYENYWGDLNKQANYPKMDIEFSEGVGYVVKCSKTACFNNAIGYNVQQNDGDKWIDVGTFNSETDELLIPIYDFTQRGHFKIKGEPKYKTSLFYDDFFSFGYQMYETLAEESFYKSSFSPINNKEFISCYNSDLYRYSIVEDTIVQYLSSKDVTNNNFKIFKPIAYSTSGKNFIAGFGRRDNRIIIGNSLDFEDNSIHQIYLDNEQDIATVAISDVGIGIYYRGWDFILYDFNNNIGLDSLRFNYSVEHLEISSDGKNFFYFNNSEYDYYKIENNSIIKITSGSRIFGFDDFFSFDALKPERMIFQVGKTIKILNREDFSIISSFDIDANEKINSVDFYSRRLVTEIGDIRRIYDFDTGELIKEIYMSISWSVYIYGNKIYTLNYSRNYTGNN